MRDLTDLLLYSKLYLSLYIIAIYKLLYILLIKKKNLSIFVFNDNCPGLRVGVTWQFFYYLLYHKVNLLPLKLSTLHNYIISGVYTSYIFEKRTF
ncbi:hypothetical protein C2G38_2125726 [Gigaspora rosea]|uniref:Uncharacterized protein n=1 Tax=Gigaspora rosea TaxID=44941 RepID=A0A397TXR0_9GLOM|nr:hypothetical protein C2G38_2125726 [Gigaspora rosea]